MGMGFLLLNIFLGLLGTFWFRTQQRRSEIALHKAHGATDLSLIHILRHMPTQLSGGQCQRVAIARAIIGNPLHQLNKEDGRTIVMVTHNEDVYKRQLVSCA